ncbi:MAG TPA: hypothetical protein VEZ90_05230 [Blastocatellia bacterium]|nr:hypothetical protein [Blastocatellia bacterium]
MHLSTEQLRKALPRLIVAGLATLYFLWCAWDPGQWHMIDGVDLLIHEAGHIVFMPFGHFIMIAGGSMFQVIMPAAFVVYFYWNGKSFEAALVSFWVGESILNVSVYAADSIKMQLPLIGGPDSIHDWNYLLTETGLLSSTALVAGLIRWVGTLVILAGSVCAVLAALNKARAESDEAQVLI